MSACSPDILLAPTPPAWMEAAAGRWREAFSNDHAQCEKKAASTALALMFTYPEDRRLSTLLSRLAREELRHFEQVEEAHVAARGSVRAAAARTLCVGTASAASHRRPGASSIFSSPAL